MTLAEQQIHRQRAIQSAMIGLVGDPRFQIFMDTVRDNRELAISNLTDGTINADLITSERATLACIGEIAVWKSIMTAYDEAVAQAKQRAEETSSED